MPPNFWLWVVVGIAWLWLAGGSLLAWRRAGVGLWTFLLAVSVWTGVAGLAILFVGPYWRAVWEIFFQPGLL